VFFHELVDAAVNSAFSILSQKTETEDRDFVCSVVFSGLAPYSGGLTTADLLCYSHLISQLIRFLFRSGALSSQKTGCEWDL
jgi:hypothetical protein